MKKTASTVALLSMVAALLLLAQPVSSQNDITITDLGPIGTTGQPCDISSQGQVVGWYPVQDSKGQFMAQFLWTPENGRVDLFTTGNQGHVYINDLGQVAGNEYVYSDGNYQAVLWDQGEKMILGHLGGLSSTPHDINEVGQVVGGSRTAEGKQHAFLWTPESGMQDLGTLGGDSGSAQAVNDLGWVAGDGLTAGGQTHAFLWTPKAGMRDLGTLGGSNSQANDINNLGQVVGISLTSAGESHAFLWTAEGGMIDLGTLGGSFSLAVDINERGQIVGYSTLEGPGLHAFLWTPDGGMLDLGGLAGGYYSWASRISDSGQVVGKGYAGEWRAFVWTPSEGMVDLGTLPGGQNSDAVDVNERGQVLGSSGSTTGERHAVIWTTQIQPEDQITLLISRVEALVDNPGLKKGNANALLQKLENADRMLEEGKINAACGQLGAFVNQVEAVTNSGHLPEEEGAGLIDGANNAIDQLCA
jgi:probable HAF family extracellular repeat protein